MSHALTSRRRHLNAVTAVDLGVLYTTISAGMVLARRYLTGRGVDQDFADRYGSPFGRTAAKIYRTSNGAEPHKAWSNVSGKWRRVNGYLPTETEILDEAYTAYPRTRDYVVTAEPASEPSAVEGCQLAACDGTWHYDGVCVVQLGQVDFDGPDVALSAELSATEGGAPTIVAFEFNMSSLNTRREMRDRASASEFTAQLRRLANAIDGAATILPA